MPRKYNTTEGHYYGASLDDAIIEWLIDPKAHPLAEDSQEMMAFKRISAADDLVKKWGHKKAISMHAKLNGVSYSLAVADINSANYIFGNSVKIDKRVAIMHMIDRARDAYNNCNELGDMMAAAKFLEIEQRLVTSLPDPKENEKKPVITLPVLNAIPIEVLDQEGQIIDIEVFKAQITAPKDAD